MSHQKGILEQQDLTHNAESGCRVWPPIDEIHYDDYQITSTTTTGASGIETSTAYADRLCDVEQMRRAFVEAEKRGDWLRGELNMFRECATEQVRELKRIFVKHGERI